MTVTIDEWLRVYHMYNANPVDRKMYRLLQCKRSRWQGFRMFEDSCNTPCRHALQFFSRVSGRPMLCKSNGPIDKTIWNTNEYYLDKTDVDEGIKVREEFSRHRSLLCKRYVRRVRSMEVQPWVFHNPRFDGTHWGCPDHLEGATSLENATY